MGSEMCIRDRPGILQGASLRGRLPSSATLAHNANGADTEVHDFRRKLTTCKCQELHGSRQQSGYRLHVRNTQKKKDGEKEQCSTLLRSKLKANPLRITPALCERCIFVGRADFDFFVRFENSACCIHARRHVLALANSVCLLALSHSDRHANVLVRVHCTKKRPTKAKTTGKI